MESRIFSLDRGRPGAVLKIENLSGGQAFISRASGRGFTPGATIRVVRNHKIGPLIVFLRDTQIALGRSEAGKIMVEELNP